MKCRRTLMLRRQIHSKPKYPFLDGKLSIVKTNRRLTSERRKSEAIKYVVRPGYLDQPNGNRIYLDSATLIELYNVSLNECIELHNNDKNFHAKFCRYINYRYIFLYPRTDNNYSWYKNSKIS